MREAWDRFAADDPMFYIHCGRDDWDREEFFATGEAEVAEWLEWIGDDAVKRGAAMEIGCGIGRVCVALAGEFERVTGLDISATMIEQARELAPPANVQYAVIPGDGDLAGMQTDEFDFVVSRAVFHHVPNEETIKTYLAEIARVLRSDGAALLQFNTKPGSHLRSVVYLLPDFMLPRTSRRFMRSYRRDQDRARQLATGAGLQVEWERGRGSRFHYFFLRKPAVPAARG